MIEIRNNRGEVLWRAYVASLEGANLSGLNLRGAQLSRAYLKGADMSGCCLIGADLQGALLNDVDLRNSDLSSADLRHVRLVFADLRRANFYGANLRLSFLQGARFDGASLYYADFYGATLFGTDVSHARYDSTTQNINLVCPDVGGFYAWKKVDGRVVKLYIPASAKRSSATTRKCRASVAIVKGIYDTDGNLTNETTVCSNQYVYTEYTVGQKVYPDGWDEDRWKECSHGIHFFMTFREAAMF